MKTVADKAIKALTDIPFENIIGGPLNACVNAQSQAALSTVNFIQSVGLNQAEDGSYSAVYVLFSFVQGGRMAIISVPLLAIVPIPYIAIQTVDIAFKAVITGMDKTSYTDEYSRETKVDTSTKKKGLGWFSVKSTTMNSSISTKRDSKSTQDSSYSIEATIDVNVHAEQDSMPAGMAKVLEMLGNAIDLCNPMGELTVSDTQLTLDATTKSVELIATYKNSEGKLNSQGIKYLKKKDNDKKFDFEKAKDGVYKKKDETMTFTFTEAGTYYVGVSEENYEEVVVE